MHVYDNCLSPQRNNIGTPKFTVSFGFDNLKDKKKDTTYVLRFGYVNFSLKNVNRDKKMSNNSTGRMVFTTIIPPQKVL